MKYDADAWSAVMEMVVQYLHNTEIPNENGEAHFADVLIVDAEHDPTARWGIVGQPYTEDLELSPVVDVEGFIGELLDFGIIDATEEQVVELVQAFSKHMSSEATLHLSEEEYPCLKVRDWVFSFLDDRGLTEFESYQNIDEEERSAVNVLPRVLH